MMLDIPGYKLIGTLRMTGANVLFDAIRESDGLPVVIKTPTVQSPGPRERERYRREFLILQRLREVAGVVRAYSHEHVLDHPLITMEKLAGEPLSELVGQPLAVPRFLELALSLASTLAELHCRGVVHKDIKPANIIAETTGGTRLVDFGVASLQWVEHLDATPANLIEGTLAYMSPEQTGRMNRQVDYRTDFYSLGVTFYELLTGSRPFHGRDALEWFHAHMAWSPRPPHEVLPSIPPALSAMVMKLLAKTAEERYQSAEGLRADLEKVREGALEVFPLGTRDVSRRFQLPQRLYGREAQVSTLLGGFERVLHTGQPELMLVHGYSGIGKSSVALELHKPVVQRRGFLLSGKFDQFHRDIPYATLAEAIRGLVQQLLAGTDTELARWRERLQAAWAEHGQVLVELVPQLELIAGRQPPLQELAPTEAQNRFRQVFRKFLGVFATQEHPLVVFLDDLQWADQASLQLIQHLLTHSETPPLLLLGAYRDNEVGPAHPLTLTLEEVRKSGARVTDLHLEPLDPEQVEHFVADALPGAEREVVVPLSALVREKTGGNPFFLGQLMLALDRDGLLTRTHEGRWRWDAERVRAMGYSDNVVHFLVDKLRQLPPEVQRLLSLAACMGNVFSLPTLLPLSELGDVGEVERGLGPALQEGLLMHGAGPDQYRFLHDRIHQAAHDLISEEQRKAIHLRIGRSLLASLSPEELREKLFDVVSQLNAAVELLHEPAERHQLARLNEEAGSKAKASLAHRPAITYFSTAFSLIPGDPWETDAALAFKVRLEWAWCEFTSGRAAELQGMVEDLLPRARTRADLEAAYRLKIAILVAMARIPEAKTCVLECLELLGVSIPSHPSREEATAAYEEVWALLGERPIESLVNLPPMTDPDMKVTMNVLDLLFAPAYFTHPPLLIVGLCRMVSLTLRHGLTETAAPGFSWMGVMACSFFNRYREGHAWGQLARALLERYPRSIHQGKVLYSLQFISYWNQPLPATQELVLSGFHHALQTGDFPAACYCGVNITLNRLAMGHHLEDVYQESVVRCDFARKSGSVDPQDILLVYQRYVQQLRGYSLSFDTLSGEGFDEQTFEASLTSARMSALRCVYGITRLKSRFMSGAHHEALEAADKVAGLIWVMKGSINLLDYHLYRALALAASCGEEATQAREKSLEAIRSHHQQLAQWADNVPETFRSPERMVFAELARLEGRLEEAIRAYGEAIHSARKNGFTHNVGIAAELAANFWRAQQMPMVARGFASEAYVAYRQWGALAKARHMEERWPDLSPSRSASNHETPSSDSKQIDALTVVKAQQAISGEIVLERLVTTLLKVTIANAGAQRGALLLPSGDSLSVTAVSGASPDSVVIPSAEDPLPELPWTIIAYVKRTHTHVLINDASRPHPFSSDPYLRRGGARSVLCLPLMRREVFSGVLYLENELATSAFSAERLSLLSHLASQAATSIENARLYADVQQGKAALRQANDELERRVEERTRELKEAQARLVETAHEAGMAEVASNVLHNVGNVLTSAVINVEMMRRHVGASRVSRVKQASALLQEHRDALTDFLTRDARGRQLPDYLAELSDELLREQERLMGDVEAMSRYIDHIRAIVHVQQDYAKTSLLAVECDLAQLVEDALHIQMASLKRHGISTTRELSVLPRVQVDKHKVLQILINLISNAKHAMDVLPESQRVLRVRLTAEGRRARIQVVDNGMGIAPEVRERLFSHGFTTRKNGHGFGLHASVLAAQMMGGRLTLESEGPGKGATATLELPLP